jgi:exosortase H (IPTLxxWG-CTERM-specific)
MSGQQKYCFAAGMACFTFVLLFIYRQDALGNILSPLTYVTARITAALLQVTGIEAARTATMICHPDGFAYEIYYRCTGFFPVAILTASIIAYPGPVRHRFLGLALGVAILLALNLFRLVCLFYVGVYRSDAFDFAHSVLGNGLMLSATLGLWVALTEWNRKMGSRTKGLSI